MLEDEDGRQIELFRPRRPDGRALWRAGFEWICVQLELGSVRMGDIVSHEDFAEAIGTPALGPTYYQTIARITHELQENHQVTLIVVRGQGYRIARGMAQMQKGIAERDSSQRMLSKAAETIRTTSEEGLSPAEVRRLRSLGESFDYLAQIMGQTVDEVARHRREIAMLKDQSTQSRTYQENSQEEMEDMKRMLADYRRRTEVLEARQREHG
jgi:hypothetical protein